MTQISQSQSGGHAFALGRYVLTSRIATGGMATVYRARIQSAGVTREFAVKVLHPHLAGAKNIEGRFLDEARVASRINHPNVVSTIDVGTSRGYQYLVLELIHGVTLRQLQLHRPRCPRLLATDAARIIADAARGLHAVHTATDEEDRPLHVVHRDVSPHNLMLDTRGRTVLIDLGLSKSDGQECHTQTGVLCGKLPYMSPEQSRLDQLDARSDLFSLGSVLFELCTGELPFGDAHSAQTLEALRTCDQAALQVRLEAFGVPEWIQQIILGCLHADPDHRFGSALEVAQALEENILTGTVEHLQLRRRLAALSLEAKLANPTDNDDDTAGSVRPLPCIPLPTPGTGVVVDPGASSATDKRVTARLRRVGRLATDRFPPLRMLGAGMGRVASHRLTDTGVRVVDSARWLTLGAAIALLAVAGTRMLRADEAASDEQSRSMSAGLAADTAPPVPAEPVESLGPRTLVAPPLESLELGSTSEDGALDAGEIEDAEAQASSKRQRRRVLHRRSKVARKLRGNPYQD